MCIILFAHDYLSWNWCSALIWYRERTGMCSKEVPFRNSGAVVPHGPLTRYVKLRVAHTQGMPGTFSLPHHQRKPLVTDPGMHHGKCVTHVGIARKRSVIRNPYATVACATRNFTHLARGPCIIMRYTSVYGQKKWTSIEITITYTWSV